MTGIQICPDPYDFLIFWFGGATLKIVLCEKKVRKTEINIAKLNKIKIRPIIRSNQIPELQSIQ